MNNTNDASTYATTPDGILALTIESDGVLNSRMTNTTGAIRLGGGNGAGNSRVYIQSAGDSSYIDSYGGGGYQKLGIQASRLILNSSTSGYVGIGNTFPIGTNTKLGVSFNVGGSAANLGESVNYSTFSLYPYRVGSDHGMFFGNQGYTAGYIQSAHGATPGASTGTLSLNPFGGNVGVGNGTSAPSTKLSVNGANYVEMATFAAASGATAGIISTNNGYITSFTARHNTNTAVFYPVASGNSASSGIKILKGGIVHITVTQDFISSGSTGYAAVFIRKNGSNIAESLRTNTNSQWNMFNSTVTTTVAVNDIISFYFSSANFTSMDPGTWSQYSFMWTSR